MHFQAIRPYRRVTILPLERCRKSELSVCSPLAPARHRAGLDSVPLTSTNHVMLDGSRSYLWKNCSKQRTMRFSSSPVLAIHTTGILPTKSDVDLTWRTSANTSSQSYDILHPCMVADCPAENRVPKMTQALQRSLDRSTTTAWRR